MQRGDRRRNGVEGMGMKEMGLEVKGWILHCEILLMCATVAIGTLYVNNGSVVWRIYQRYGKSMSP